MNTGKIILGVGILVLIVPLNLILGSLALGAVGMPVLLVVALVLILAGIKLIVDGAT